MIKHDFLQIASIAIFTTQNCKYYKILSKPFTTLLFVVDFLFNYSKTIFIRYQFTSTRKIIFILIDVHRKSKNMLTLK